MRVLVVEDRPGAAATTTRRLGDAGYEPVSCADPDGSAPCRALGAGGTCPLDEAPVDVAVISALTADRILPGLVCAHRRRIPTVTLGDRDLGELVGEVERAATTAPPGDVIAARAAMRDALDRAGLAGAGADVEVTRDGDRLRVRATTDRAVSMALTHAAAVRVLAAVRRADPAARAIGVTVRSGC